MVMISEIRGSDVGSLGGLGQTKSGRVFGDARDEGGALSQAMPLKQQMAIKPQIGQLQLLLNSLGYTVPVDGVFGPATDKAVRLLQEKVGMPVDGVFTPELAARIENVEKKEVAPTASEARRIVIAQPAAPSAMVVSGQGQPMAPPQSGVMTFAGSFFTNLKNAARAQPALFAVGAVAVIAAFIFVPKLLKGMRVPGMKMEPVQVMGLPKRKTKRKSKKKA